MYNFFIILFIRSIDLPILEDNPFLFSRLKWKILLWLPFYSTEFWHQIEWDQAIDESNYTHLVGLYEYELFLKLYERMKNNYMHGNFILALFLIFTTLFSWHENISFLFYSVMLPLSFYYFCVLVDYYEAIEELLKHIRYILSKNT
jgi:hypothetical protein